MRRAISATIIGLLTLAACGGDDPGLVQPGEDTTAQSVNHSSGDNSGGAIEVRVQGSLEEIGSDRQLCPGGTGPCWLVTNGGADAELGYVVAQGRVVDGAISLTSVEPADDTAPSFPDPCEDEDLGRWDHQGDMEAIEAAAPSLAGTWLTSDQRTLVMVVVDDVEGTRDRLAAAGHTGICVADLGFEHTFAYLQAAQAEIGQEWQEWAEQGWHLTGSSIDVSNNRVSATFDRIDQGLRTSLADSQYASAIAVKASIEVLDDHRVADLDQPPSANEITITTQPRTSAGMDALGAFVLRYDSDAHCLWFQDADGARVKPIWPYGTTALRDPIVVFDGRGRPVAAVDQEIATGGGFGQVLPDSDDPSDCGAAVVWVIAPNTVGR